MAETTGIAWTDATQNFWEGCTKVGPGCDHCYAEHRDQRFHEGSHWGPGAPRRRMVDATFRRPLAWDRARAAYEAAQVESGPVWGDRPAPPLWVFSLSLGDFFDNEVDPAWRADAWKIIKACPHLRWQLVTKRVGNVHKMLPEDWGLGVSYSHVGIIATTVNQEELLRDGPKLLDLKSRWDVEWVGLSIEPQLDQINLFDLPGAERLDWVITGGESKQGPGHKPRPYDIGWTRSLLWQCSNLNVPCFVKQLGDNPVEEWKGRTRSVLTGAHTSLSNAGGMMDQWPEDLRVRQMPRVYDRMAD